MRSLFLLFTAATPAGTMGRLSTTECTYLPTYLRRRRRVSSSFVDFRRVRRLVRRVLLPLELTKPVFPGYSGPYCFFLAVWLLLSWWLGRQVRGLVGWSNLDSFLVEPTSFDSFRLSSLRIVLPLELEICFVCKIGSLVVIALRWLIGYPPPHQGTDFALVSACWRLFVLAVSVWEHRE